MWDTNAVPTNNCARISCFRLSANAHATLSFSLALVFPLSHTTSLSPLTVVPSRFSPSHRRQSPSSLETSLSFSSASALHPTTTKKRLGARSTLLLLQILHSRFVVLHSHFVIHSSLRSLLFFICRVYIAWSHNFVLPVVTEEARVHGFLLMGLEKAEANEETVRASMVSSTIGALEQPGRRRSGELGSLLQSPVVYLFFCYFCLFLYRGGMLHFSSWLYNLGSSFNTFYRG